MSPEQLELVKRHLAETDHKVGDIGQQSDNSFSVRNGVITYHKVKGVSGSFTGQERAFCLEGRSHE